MKMEVETARSEKAVDRSGQPGSEQIRMSRVKPLRGAEGALDILICSERFVAVAIDGAMRSGGYWNRAPPRGTTRRHKKRG